MGGTWVTVSARRRDYGSLTLLTFSPSLLAGHRATVFSHYVISGLCNLITGSGNQDWKLQHRERK